MNKKINVMMNKGVWPFGGRRFVISEKKREWRCAVDGKGEFRDFDWG